MPQEIASSVDPLALDREWAANSSELLGAHAESLAKIITQSELATPFLLEFAAVLRKRADADFAKAVQLRGAHLAGVRPQRSEVPLRLV